MVVIDIQADARRMFDALTGDGIVVLPDDAGYALTGASWPAVQRINRTKGRGWHDSRRSWDHAPPLDVILAGEAAKSLAPGECALVPT